MVFQVGGDGGGDSGGDSGGGCFEVDKSSQASWGGVLVASCRPGHGSSMFTSSIRGLGVMTG